ARCSASTRSSRTAFSSAASTRSARTGWPRSPTSNERGSAGRKRWSNSSRSASRSTASRRHSSTAPAKPRSSSQTRYRVRRTCPGTVPQTCLGESCGLECAPGECFVELPGQAAHADRAHSRLALERCDAAEEEREERVETLALNSVFAHLLRQFPRRARVAPCGGVRLPLRVQARVRRRAVHRRRRNQLAVRIRDENRDRPGRFANHEIHDRPRGLKL